MSERDYSNNWEDFWRDYPDGQNQAPGGVTAPQTDPNPDPYVETAVPPPDAPKPVKEGTAIDKVQTSPPPPTYYPQDTGGGYSAPSAPSFNWPVFDAPAYESPGPFVPRRNTFSFEDFAAPTMQEAESDPGYAFSRDQGRKALETSAAARGILRSGGTLKDILEYGNKFAEQNYGNVFNRAQSVWGGNRQNALDKFQLEYGVDRDVYDRMAADVGNKNQYNYRSAWDKFSSLDSQRKFELSDALSRWQSQLSALTSLSQPVG
ncbi:MAG: hypothetical protein RLY20_3164 [Verrucomicrobiota bacterium]|jgi:hypothetical protein